MKIYIINLPLQEINIQKLVNNPNLNCRIKYVTELYSEIDGNYILEKNNYYRIEPSFNENYEIIKNYFINNGNSKYDLLLNNNTNTLVPITSQLPIKYIMNKVEIYTFFTGKKSNLEITFRLLDNKIIDFYFEYIKKDFNLDILNDTFFKEEINMFLSYLK